MFITIDQNQASITNDNGEAEIIPRSHPVFGDNLDSVLMLSYEPDRGLYHIVPSNDVNSVTVCNAPEDDARMLFIHQSVDEILAAAFPPRTIEIAKEEKHRELSTACAVAMMEFKCASGITYQSSQQSLTFLNSALSFAQSQNMTDIEVRGADKVRYTILVEAFADDVAQLNSNVQTLLIRKWNLQDAAKDAATISDVDAIRW